LPDDPKDRTGFQKSFPASQKPLPKRLFLRGEHLAYMCSNGGSEIKFTPARFNTAPADDADTRCGERIIVTSTGPYVITWNLRQVLQTGKGDKYNIKVYPEKVVADNFRFGQDRSIIVTLPNDVTMIRRDQM
ncbi:Vacuolar import and degradation protein 27, partial [Spiromyces aspiralis]